MTPHSILIPHDGSPLSGTIVDALAPLLDGGVNVTLLHVVEEGSAGADSLRRPARSAADGALDGSALDASEAAVQARGATVTRIERRARDVAAAIVDDVAASRPDLVAMTTHGRGGFSRLVRGSVAERVLRACPAPLWMVNPKTHPTARLARILVALDGSEEAERILDVVIPIARRTDARATLLYVDWDAATDTPAQAAKRRGERAGQVRDWLAAALARLEREAVPATLEIARGDVAGEILRAADPARFDLLALSTHGRSGPGRWLLGSIAEQVLGQCRIPVLLTRTAG
ncbi:MAG: universal stress protein [Myxococcota bacterium]